MPHYSEQFLLERLRAQSPEAVDLDTDRPCPTCGYNLRGRDPNHACPECGQVPPRLAFSTPDDLVGTGDPHARRRWQIGLGLGAVCLYVAVFGRWISLVAAVFFTAGTPDIYLYLMVVNALLWTIAVWMVTPKAIDHHWSHLQIVRWIVRLTQCLWPLALGVYAYARIAPMLQATEDRLIVQQFVVRVVAMLGVISLAWLVHVLAVAAQRDKAARRMLIVMWGLPPVALVVAAFPEVLPWVFLVPLGFALFAWAWIMILFAASLRELSSHAGWSLRAMHEFADRDRRVTAKKEEFERELAERVRPTSPQPPGDVPLEG